MERLLYLTSPEILEKRCLDLPGTTVGADRAPYLNLWNGIRKLNYNFVDNPNQNFGSVVCDSCLRSVFEVAYPTAQVVLLMQM